MPVLYPLGMIVETLMFHILNSYLHTSDIVARADLDAQYGPISGTGASPIRKQFAHLVVEIFLIM